MAKAPYMFTRVGLPREHAIERRSKRTAVSHAPLAPGGRPAERFTPPCVGCRYPLLKGEDVCPRCSRSVQVEVHDG